MKTMSGLIAVVGATLLTAGWRGRVGRETALLGAGSAAALGWADVYYVARGRISKVYLLDVAAELPFLAGWATFARREGRAGRDRRGVGSATAVRPLGELPA